MRAATRGALVALIAAGVGGAAFPAAASAQNTWISAWGGIFMDPGTVRDGESGTRWDFGTSPVFGVTAQRVFGGSLIAGLEVGYAPMRHEVRYLTTDSLVADGRAHLLSTMLAGRLGGGGGGFFTYLSGGIGALTYGIPGLERWDTDPALRGGGGLEYRHTPNLALFLEWNRWWAFHQSEGVDDNTVNHGHLEVGVRFGT
ncbi:MAG TPA: outer membrane beta-barrel protein [Longimicrobiales bacterium]|nr:outer membrane beta-barrel protein [Longimicrobiales bacterium]